MPRRAEAAEQLSALAARVQGSQPPAPPAAAEALAGARRALGDGRVEEALTRLRGLVAEQPRLGRGAPRAARRAARAEAAPGAGGRRLADGFPELEATFQAALTKRDPVPAAAQATQVSPGTELMPTVLATSGASAAAPRLATPASNRRWLLAGGALVVVAAAAAAVLLRPSPPPAPVPGPVELRLPVRSQPAGAAVWLDGRDTGVVTNGELVLKPPLPAQVTLTLKREGRPDATRTLQLPLAPGAAAEFELGGAARSLPVRTQPPGATVTLDGAAVAGVTPLELSLDPEAEHKLAVSLDGYASQEIRVKPGSSPAALELDAREAGAARGRRDQLELPARRGLARAHARQGRELAARPAARAAASS